MSFWTAAIIIVAIWGFVQIYQSKRDADTGVVRDEDGNPVGNPRREAELQAEIRELHERIRVLERIATDDREAKRLSSEIDSLRNDD